MGLTERPNHAGSLSTAWPPFPVRMACLRPEGRRRGCESCSSNLGMIKQRGCNANAECGGGVAFGDSPTAVARCRMGRSPTGPGPGVVSVTRVRGRCPGPFTVVTLDAGAPARAPAPRVG